MNYFRFTDLLDRRSDCEEWFEHFKDHGIPAAIVYDSNHRDKQYSVWRGGVDGDNIGGLSSF